MGTKRYLTVERPDTGATVDFLTEHVHVEVVVADGQIHVDARATKGEDDYTWEEHYVSWPLPGGDTTAEQRARIEAANRTLLDAIQRVAEAAREAFDGAEERQKYPGWIVEEPAMDALATALRAWTAASEAIVQASSCEDCRYHKTRAVADEVWLHDVDIEENLGALLRAPYTLCKFLAANTDMDPDEVAEIRRLKVGERYTGGGGACPLWTIQRVSAPKGGAK